MLVAFDTIAGLDYWFTGNVNIYTRYTACKQTHLAIPSDKLLLFRVFTHASPRRHAINNLHITDNGLELML